MRTVFDKLAKYALIRAIVYILLGALMVIAPQPIMNLIVYILAGYAILMGILSIINYFRMKNTGTMGFDFVSGILMIVLGVVLLVFTKQIISVLPIFLGVILVIGGASNFAQALGGGRAVGKTNVFLVVLSLLIMVGGILVIVNPFSSAVLLFRIFGVITIIMGISELTSYFMYKDVAKK